VPARSLKKAILLSVLIMGILPVGEWNHAQAATAPAAVAPLFTPMSDAAAEGVGCLAVTAPIMTAAYMFGPTEIMMLVTGAVIVPSSSAQLFISLGGILGAAACGAGAAITPSVIWVADQLSQISTNSSVAIATEAQPQDAAITTPVNLNTNPEPVVQSPEVSEDVIQGTGCFAGMLALSAITLASSPIEIVGLAAGGVAVPTNTSIMLLSIVGTIIPAGCTLGAAIALPVVAMSKNASFDAIDKGMAYMFGWNKEAAPATPAATGLKTTNRSSGI
jgi:hypothetical protein